MITEETGSARRGWTPPGGGPHTIFPEEEIQPITTLSESRDRHDLDAYGEKADSLIKGILRLYIQVSTRLLQLRVDRSGSTTGSATDIDFAGCLIARVRKQAAESNGDRGASPAMAPEIPLLSSVAEDANGSALGGATVAELKPSAAANELSLHLSKGPRAGGLQPHIGEQLKRRTFEYINQALELARQGKIESAEICAKLAQSALKTAAEYLSAEEFLAFKNEVMSRVQPADESPG